MVFVKKSQFFLVFLFSRSGNRLSYYTLDNTQQLVCKDSIAISNIQHTCVNPHYPESVFVTDEGTVQRWTEHAAIEEIVKEWWPRFEVDHDTRTVSV